MQVATGRLSHEGIIPESLRKPLDQFSAGISRPVLPWEICRPRVTGVGRGPLTEWGKGHGAGSSTSVDSGSSSFSLVKTFIPTPQRVMLCMIIYLGGTWVFALKLDVVDWCKDMQKLWDTAPKQTLFLSLAWKLDHDDIHGMRWRTGISGHPSHQQKHGWNIQKQQISYVMYIWIMYMS